MSSSGTPPGAVVAVGDVALILLVSVIFGRLAVRLRQPAVIGELVAGIILGPSLLGLLPGHLTMLLFPAGARPYLSLLAQVGLTLFMFGVGWEVDAGVLRYRGRSVAGIAVTSMVVPFALGLALAPWLYQHHSVVHGRVVSFTPFALYIGILMAITAFPVLARIVADFGLQRLRSGAIALGSAATADLLAWCVLAVVVAPAGSPQPSATAPCSLR
jgi:Kef-type K+ transport system membrane component KefB